MYLSAEAQGYEERIEAMQTELDTVMQEREMYMKSSGGYWSALQERNAQLAAMTKERDEWKALSQRQLVEYERRME